ncbi:calmodulin-binding protein 25-like [Olea europaea var. sylvestris]|uniref:calmodulin-binding protein 25-like n=1 Tax=Olea europaea var. sylvestris TaxID=158386 RepID=UPI000C1D7092|nr:calmodulin-binding protein 25-like [Olea europaea var. sylvestris]
MASSENLMAMEKSWPPFRSTLSDSWFFDIFSNKETEALTKALKKSFTNPSIDDDSSHDFSTGTVESFLVSPELRPVQTPTVAGGLGSGVSFAKSRFEAPAGKITKRKSRTSKRAAATTFITADAANFRQMVQQVTGLRFGGLNPAAQVLKPQPLPQRAMNHMQDGGCLPTLDTSAFLLGQVGSTSFQSVELPAGNVPPSPSGAGGFEYDSFFSFPTLESWKAV